MSIVCATIYDYVPVSFKATNKQHFTRVPCEKKNDNIIFYSNI